MAVVYSEVDKSDRIYQPTSVRWRHRYRGPRDSLKTNTHIAQFYYDTNRLNRLHTITHNGTVEYVNLISNGGTVSGLEYLWSQDATPMEEQVVVESITDFASRLDKLKTRIRNLEN